MLSFAQFIAESFLSHVNLIWNLSRPECATAAFTVDSVKVIVSFEQRETRSAWHVVFEVEEGDKTQVAYSAFSIFNGVFQAVQEFMEVWEPEKLVFATKRDELAGIYRTYLRKEASTLEKLGYKLEGPHRVDPFMTFVVRRAA